MLELQSVGAVTGGREESEGPTRESLALGEELVDGGSSGIDGVEQAVHRGCVGRDLVGVVEMDSGDHAFEVFKLSAHEG